MSDPILRVEDVHKSYGETEVLRGVSFEQGRAETKVVIGSSGSGKSTLLRCVNLLNRPDRGRVWLEGTEVTAPGMDLNRVRRQIGMVFQDFNLFTHLTALDNVRLGPVRVRHMPRHQATELAMEELERVGLAEKRDSYPAELSGGQKQRVSIARALAMQPKIILFDEPTSALDPELIGEVLSVMISLAREGLTMLVVTHELEFARAVSDEVIFLEGGAILEQAPPDVLFSRPANERTRQFIRKITDLQGRGSGPRGRDPRGVGERGGK